MGSLRGVTISEGNIGANVAGDGREFGLIGNGVAVTDKLTLDTPYTLQRPADAEALATGAKIVVTACPYCMTMITDGIKYKDKEEEVQNLDVAELVAMGI